MTFSEKAGRFALGSLPVVVSLSIGALIAYFANSSRVFSVCILLAGFGAGIIFTCALIALIADKWGKVL